MRFLLGLVVGIGLTIGGAYLHDSRSAPPEAAANATRPMVNWDVVESTWQHTTARLQREWDKLAAK